MTRSRSNEEFYPPYPPFSIDGCQKCGNPEPATTWSEGPTFYFGHGIFNGEHLWHRCRCGFGWATETLDATPPRDTLNFEEALAPTGETVDLDNLTAPLAGNIAVRESHEPTRPCAVCLEPVRTGETYAAGHLAGLAFCEDHDPRVSDADGLEAYARTLGEEGARVRYLVGKGQGFALGVAFGHDGPAVLVRGGDGTIVSRDPRLVTVVEE